MHWFYFGILSMMLSFDYLLTLSLQPRQLQVANGHYPLRFQVWPGGSFKS